MSFEILNSTHLCVRGLRTPFRKQDEANTLENFHLKVIYCFNIFTELSSQQFEGLIGVKKADTCFSANLWVTWKTNDLHV